MNGKPGKLLPLALLAALGATGLQAKERSAVREARPAYQHDRDERQEVPAPAPRTLPESLRIALPRDEAEGSEGDSRDAGAARTQRGPAQPVLDDDLEARARQAATWAAGEAIERYGRPRYFEIGFHESLHDAFRRTRRDRWEFDQGHRSGRLDPEARRLGEEIGYEEGRLLAAEEARLTVSEQFADLTRQPVRLPAPPPPPFSAAGFTVAEPQLRDVFHDLSWRGRRAAGFRDLRLDPWRLYRAGRHADFYDGDWCTGRFGLDLWLRRHRKRGWLRELDRDQRRLFEQRFELLFEAELARRFAHVADHAFDRGYVAGWRYGIRVGREWQYRRGYHAGFETGVSETARAVFFASFRPSWAAAYDALFGEWSTTVKLQTRAARLRDGNDDGIFEPGEELFAELELANLGGGSGRLEARLAGSVLAGSGRLAIDLPPRSVVRQPAPLRGLISPAAAPMSDAVLTLSIGDLAERLALRVSHVLRFEGGPVLATHDALRGTAVIDV
ncbi:MAG: hypothetical protein ACE5EG_11720, partial [Thermoanaerobaculia bacterium]